MTHQAVRFVVNVLHVPVVSGAIEGTLAILRHAVHVRMNAKFLLS